MQSVLVVCFAQPIGLVRSSTHYSQMPVPLTRLHSTQTGSQTVVQLPRSRRVSMVPMWYGLRPAYFVAILRLFHPADAPWFRILKQDRKAAAAKAMYIQPTFFSHLALIHCLT